MAVSSDVNVIFAYTDPNHFFHNKVALYMAKKKRYSYALLAQVKKSFIFTYKNLLADCGNSIFIAVTEYRDKREKLKDKRKPSNWAVSTIINNRIKTTLEKYKREEKNFPLKFAKEYVDLLLSEFSIPELYENDESLALFREKYVLETENIAIEKLNGFLEFFQDFDLMHIEQYNQYDDWLKKIKRRYSLINKITKT